MVIKKGGKKAKKGKKIRTDLGIERPLLFKEPGQEYAHVDKMLGDCRVAITCADGKERLGHIRGTMTHRRKVFINPGDVVLCGLRDYEDAKADIMYLYTKKEVKKLIDLIEIPPSFLDADAEETEHDLGFDIGEESEESDTPRVNRDLDIDAL